MYTLAGAQYRLKNTIFTVHLSGGTVDGVGGGGGALVWDQCQMWGKWEGILGQVLEASFTLKFDSHD